MVSLGVTGGIGSGKSYVCSFFQKYNIPVFYTDDEAKKEMASNIEIHKELKLLIGQDVVSASGQIIKSVISQYICKGEEYANKVNAIVHPRVAQRFIRWKNSQESSIVAMECALLYESGFDKFVDYSILVTALLKTRIQRIIKRDLITREKAMEWINLQMSEEEKMKRSDFIIKNDGIIGIDIQLKEILDSISYSK